MARRTLYTFRRGGKRGKGTDDQRSHRAGHVLKAFRCATIGGGHQIHAASVDDPENGFIRSVRKVGSEKGFYWGFDPQGVPHHKMEEVLTLIEDSAAPAFRYILDRGKTPWDNALPDKWPTRRDVRMAVSWWLAAQILRTAPQRDRLWRLEGTSLEMPTELARANLHLEFIIDSIGPLARLIWQRPWGIGLTSLCLFTSDAPVQLINGRDDDDPIRAASFWDIYLPLDPHRFLYLPGKKARESRPKLSVDHLIDLPGGLAIALNQQIIESAHRHLFWHPEHDPRPWSDMKDAMRMRASRSPTSGSELYISYGTLPAGTGVERRWLDKHTWDDGDGVDRDDQPAPRSENEAREIIETLIRRMNKARAEYNEKHPI